MRHLFLLGTLFLLFLSCRSSAQSTDFKLLFSLDEEDVDYYRDTIFFENRECQELYFFRDTLYLKNDRILCFNNVEYYMHLIYMEYKKQKYIYIYPHYVDQVGPYIWYGYGVLIAINNNITIKENIDYFDSPDFYKIPQTTQFRVRNIEDTECIEHFF